MTCSATADCAAFLDQGRPSCGLSSVGPVSGRFAQHTLCRTSHKGFGRQLLFASQVECSLIAVPECLVKAGEDADVHGVGVQCMDSAQWRTYGRTIETVSISFDGWGWAWGKVSNVC